MYYLCLENCIRLYFIEINLCNCGISIVLWSEPSIKHKAYTSHMSSLDLLSGSPVIRTYLLLVEWAVLVSSASRLCQCSLTGREIFITNSVGVNISGPLIPGITESCLRSYSSGSGSTNKTYGNVNLMIIAIMVDIMMFTSRVLVAGNSQRSWQM